MEIFQLLDKSNCRECGEKTCLAFASSVFMDKKKLDGCPKLDRDTISRFSEKVENQKTVEQDPDEYLKILKNDISADIHINPWVAVPFLNYVVHGKGLTVMGNWVSFRELKNGKERYPLFQKRCEEPMKRVADTYPGLFGDMVQIFGGKKVEKQFESDISVVLHPLPKVPIMVCYWLPEDGLESSLNLYFDKTADENLDIGSVFTLGVGLAQMFEKLARRHGFQELVSSE
jgi:hypothetical protein